MAVGYTFVQAMLKAGRNPTRQDLVNAINGGLPQGVSVAPYAYSSSNHDGITGAYMAMIKNGALVPTGPGPGDRHQPDRRDHDLHRRRSPRPRPAGYRRPDQRGRPLGATRAASPCAARTGRRHAALREPERRIAA